MHSSPDRRTVLRASGVALLGGLAGCLETGALDGSSESPTDSPTLTPRGTPAATGTYADAPSGPESYPDRPDELTRESVVEYVRTYEHARVTNLLHEPDVADLHVECTGVHDTAAHGGHYALAHCTGYANYEDGLHADWGQRPALFFVAPTLTVRIEDLEDHYFHCSEVFAADDSSENFAAVCEGGDAAYEAYNVHPEPQTLSVTVAFLGDGGSETVLERTYEMGPAGGLRQGSVTYRKGTYRVTAALADGPEATTGWTLRSEQTYEDQPLTVLVTPHGGLRFHRPPFPEVR
jgi:hypothetical protein